MYYAIFFSRPATYYFIRLSTALKLSVARLPCVVCLCLCSTVVFFLVDAGCYSGGMVFHYFYFYLFWLFFSGESFMDGTEMGNETGFFSAVAVAILNPLPVLASHRIIFMPPRPEKKKKKTTIII